MNYLLRRLVPAMLLWSLLSGLALAQGRVATVDLSKVFDGYWKTKQAQAAIEDKRAGWMKEGKSLVDDWTKTKGDYEQLLADANNQALSAEKRDDLKKAAEAKLKEIKDKGETVDQFRSRAEMDLQEQFRIAQDRILSEIRTTITAKAKSGGFALVVDTAAVSGKGTPIVLFDSGENDLTPAVLAQLNASAPIDMPKPVESKDEKKGDKK